MRNIATLEFVSLQSRVLYMCIYVDIYIYRETYMLTQNQEAVLLFSPYKWRIVKNKVTRVHAVKRVTLSTC